MTESDKQADSFTTTLRRVVEREQYNYRRCQVTGIQSDSFHNIQLAPVSGTSREEVIHFEWELRIAEGHTMLPTKPGERCHSSR